MVWNLAIAALLLPLEALASNSIDNSIYRLDFTVSRGNSVQDRGVERRAQIRKREFSMEVDNQDTYYSVELEIGSEGDVNEVLVDTGSSDLWVFSSDIDCISSSDNQKRDLYRTYEGYRKNVVLHDFSELSEKNTGLKNKIGSATENIEQKAALPIGGESSATTGSCNQYGSFSTSSSDTFNKNSSAPKFSISYADGSSASGFWGYDTVKVGNISVSDLSFAVATEASPGTGVLGIGLSAGEVTYSQITDTGVKRYQYENFPMVLKSQGLIDKVAFSIYLGDENSKTGTILFGAVDHEKYTGDLQIVPMVNSYADSGYDEPPSIEVMLDSVSFNSSGSVTSVTNYSHYAILDTGSTLSYFTTNLFHSFGEQLGGTYLSDVGTYEVPCPSNSDNYVIFNFSGKEIQVPYKSLLMEYGNSCLLGIFNSSYVLLGDNFLRSAYIVMDYDDLEVSLAQVHYTDKEDIEVIHSSIPSAVSAKGYSSTSWASESESVETDISYNSGTSGSSSSKESNAHSLYSTNFYITAIITLLALAFIA